MLDNLTINDLPDGVVDVVAVAVQDVQADDEDDGDVGQALAALEPALQTVFCAWHSSLSFQICASHTATAGFGRAVL